MKNKKLIATAIAIALITAGCGVKVQRTQNTNEAVLQSVPRSSAPLAQASATSAPVQRTMAPQPASKQEIQKLTAEARRPRSVEEARKNAIRTEADVKTQCGGLIVTRITKVALLPTKDWIKLSRDSGAVPIAKYLVMYGV